MVQVILQQQQFLIVNKNLPFLQAQVHQQYASSSFQHLQKKVDWHHHLHCLLQQRLFQHILVQHQHYQAMHPTTINFELNIQFLI